MEEGELEIRNLIVKDVFTIARMLGKISKGARAELTTAILAAENDEKVNPAELGIMLFQSVFIEAEEDLKAWMAELVGKSKAEFEQMPALSVIHIVEKLVKQQDAKDFFATASSLAAGAKG